MEIFDADKGKVDAEMITSVDDYFYKLEKFKKLIKNELASIPDCDLRTAVMSWMWSKFSEDWSNQFEVIKSLPKPCQDVYACCTVVDEINNGGMNQLFFNSAGQFADMAKDGFSALGNQKLSIIMRDAISLYDRKRKLLEEHDDDSLESFSASYNEDIFTTLEEGFFREEPKFDSLLEAYIRQNSSVFGD